MLNRLFVFSVILIGLTSCSNNDNKFELNYEQAKEMMIDILQTEDAKKTLREVIQDDKMKRQLIIESDAVKNSIKDTLESNDGKKMWTNLFNDPDFVKTFADSMSDEQKKLYKGLMHDADFQKTMIDILQNPEISNQTLAILKGQQFREHLEETIKETLNSPLFQLKIKELLLKAAEKEEKLEKKDEEEEKGKEGERRY